MNMIPKTTVKEYKAKKSPTNIKENASNRYLKIIN